MSAAREAARRPLAYVRATLAAALAATRLARNEHRLPFDELIRRLRAGRRFRGALTDPAVHLRVVNRLLPALPPRAMGACLKRSLLLLHLWSRCGLEPRLHLGFGAGDERGWHSHAWLTAENEKGRLEAGSSQGYAEAFVF